jgi:hypothetical protein
MFVSIFKDFHTPVEEQDIYSLFESIKSSKYETDIKAIRYAYHQGNKFLGDELKSKLPAFTPSGTFTTRRKAELLKEYSKIIHLDFDHIERNDLEMLSTKINASSYTFASFISPSGEGLKVFVKVNCAAHQHQEAWSQLRELYFDYIEVASDSKCKDVSRLCFVSCDENLHLNKESEIFQFNEPIKKETRNEKIFALNDNPITPEYCLEFTNKKNEYIEGNRNNFIYQFSCNANRFGIGEEETLSFVRSNFNLKDFELKAAVKSAYKNNFTEFAKFAKFAEVAKFAENPHQAKSTQIETQTTDNLMDDLLFNSPTIPNSVYTSLPNLLTIGANAFEQQREKDVFLTSALSILSGCLPEVSGEYGQRTVYPNLFSFILAPAASGKGSMISAKELADKYHQELLQQSLEEKKNYDRQMREYKKRNNAVSKNSNPEEEPPEEPNFKVVFIPANTSSAKIYQHLQENEEMGIICETEADTLGMVFKNDWGSYSELLRSSFHHERVSLSRKTNREYIEINNPRLSVALSGTPNQIFNIITNAEDGLFSRFIYYLFRTDRVWISPAPKKGGQNLTELFKVLSSQVLEMVHFLKKYPTKICLPENQWETLNQAFTTHLEDIDSLVGGDALSVVKRMGLILYRFCMILTAIRKFENGDLSETIYCSNDDFQTALSLVEVYLQHSILMFNNLPNQSAQHGIKIKPKKEKFFDSLPEKFHRREAVEIGTKLGIKERTIDNTLKSWTGDFLQKEDTGIYVKVVI